MVEVLRGGLTAVPGFRCAGVRAGIKSRGLDLMLLVSDGGPVTAAGVFTTNLVKGAPLRVTHRNLWNGKLGAIVVNSGIANAYTGESGLEDARQMAHLAASCLGLNPSDVGVASTGLIGARLPMGRIKAGIEKAAAELSNTRKAGQNAARAIMTTDTVPKEVAVKVKLEDGKTVTIAGIAKGSGMIQPRLEATMLALLVTDVAITPAALKTALQASIERSFNMVTVDRETSTNDMVLVMANGLAGNRRIILRRPSERFQEGLNYVTTELARAMARDGEGASHLIEVEVKGARSERDAGRAALAVAGSNLVKAAVFGRDPNWGRIITALGYSGVSFSPSKVTLVLKSDRGKVTLVRSGRGVRGGALSRASELLRSDEVKIQVDLAAGEGEATAWGCDLTYDYVRINSQYTT